MDGSQKQNWEILFGGSEIEVQRVVTPTLVERGCKPEPEIITEKVKVRKVPLRQMAELGQAYGTIDKELACYVDKPAEYLASLTDDSVVLVIDEGRRLNEKSFAAWLRLQGQATETWASMDRKGSLNDLLNSAVAQARPSA